MSHRQEVSIYDRTFSLYGQDVSPVARKRSIEQIVITGAKVLCHMTKKDRDFFKVEKYINCLEHLGNEWGALHEQ